MPETRPTVLICDDFSTSRLILKNLLADQGYRLLFARHGAEAVAAAAAELPDLLLCDVMMPEMDGFEVVAALRANAATADMPIVLITGLDDKESRLKGMEAGADDFISKNFDKLELQTRVRSLLRLNRFRRLHQERAKFDWVVENADDGYVTLDGDGRVSYANAKARADFGLGNGHGGPPFWAAMSETHSVVGDPAADPAVYLVQPETAEATGVWHRADRFALPNDPAGQTILRLRDVTDERRMRQSLWAYRATQKYSIKVKVPKGGAQAQTADPGRGVTADEWLRVLRTWVSLAAPTGSQVLVAGTLPQQRVVLPMDGFALMAAELLQFVRHPTSEEAGPATIVAGTDEGGSTTLTVRCPTLFPNAAELRKRWTPQYRGRAAEPTAEAEHFTGEAASLVWNVGGRVDTRADQIAGWVEVTLTLPTQVGASATLVDEYIDDHSLIGG